MNKRKSLLLTITILMLAALTACGGHSGRSHGSRAAIQNETNTDVYTYELPETAQSLTLDLNFTATQGSIHWTVTDPNGQVGWEGSLDSPNSMEERVELPFSPGRWTLQVSMDQLSGSYDIEWRSR